jgi:hypothetical protein
MVRGVMATGSTNDQWNMSQMWMAASYGKTTAKVGRMELDTPLAFTEKWNVAKNTFEAAVLINSDIENTTLVAAYVGKDNGNVNAAIGGDMNTTTNPYGLGQTAYMGGQNDDGSTFRSFYGGAYAFGVVNTSIENTTLQAWYYDVNDLADAIWLQADVKNIADMVNVGVQYGSIDSSKDNSIVKSADDLDAWAAKISGTVSDVNLFVAYSDVSEAKTQQLVMANTATQDKTKLYTGTGSIYMDGSVVGSADTQTWKIGASTTIAGYSLAANYTSADNGGNGAGSANDWDVDGYDFSVGTKVGAIALKAIYTAIDADENNAKTSALTPGYVAGKDFETIRIIASVKF